MGPDVKMSRAERAALKGRAKPVAPIAVEPVVPEAPEAPAPVETEFSPQPVEIASSEPESLPVVDIPADPSPSRALEDRIAALEAIVAALQAAPVAGNMDASVDSMDAPVAVHRKRDPVRLRMIRRYIEMRQQRAADRARIDALDRDLVRAQQDVHALKAEMRTQLDRSLALQARVSGYETETFSNRAARRRMVRAALRSRGVAVQAREAERAASAEARAAMAGMRALNVQCEALQARVDQLEQWDEPVVPAPRRFEAVR